MMATDTFYSTESRLTYPTRFLYSSSFISVNDRSFREMQKGYYAYMGDEIALSFVSCSLE